MFWTREGISGAICLCGNPNPDGGDRCGNCDEYPYSVPEIMTPAQKATHDAIKNGKVIYRSAA